MSTSQSGEPRHNKDGGQQDATETLQGSGGTITPTAEELFGTLAKSDRERRMEEREEELAKYKKALRKELEELNPMESLRRVAFAWEHRAGPGDVLNRRVQPLDDVEIGEVRQKALRHIRAQVAGKASVRAQENYLREALLDLEMMDFKDSFGMPGHVVSPVLKKTHRLLEHVEAKREREREQRDEPKPQPAAEAETLGTPDRWRNLARAAVVLERRADLDTKGDFKGAARDMREELGMEDSKTPGVTVWGSVHRLVKEDVLKVQFLPQHYEGMAGFRRLVEDLTAGTASEKPKGKQQNT